MGHQKQHAEDKSKNSKQAHIVQYSLDELLSNNAKDAFSLDAEDKHWLDGPLVEKRNC